MMYDSRTHKPRRPGSHRYLQKHDRMGCYCCPHLHLPKPEENVEQVITEGVLAYLEEGMSARLPMDCEAVEFVEPRPSMHVLNRLHDEAERMNATQHLCFTRDCDLPDWECALLTGDPDEDYYRSFMEDPWLGESPYFESDDHYYEGDGTPNMNTSDDCWMPYGGTMAKVRETFGGSDFLVVRSGW